MPSYSRNRRPLKRRVEEGTASTDAIKTGAAVAACRGRAWRSQGPERSSGKRKILSRSKTMLRILLQALRHQSRELSGGPFFGAGV